MGKRRGELAYHQSGGVLWVPSLLGELRSELGKEKMKGECDSERISGREHLFEIALEV